MTDAPPPVERALEALETAYDVRVLLAREVGSRAWGLAGPGSDHDVGVVFVQPPVAYVQLGTYVESVHDELAGVDVKAWNLKRFAELVAASNPAALEFLGSLHRRGPERRTGQRPPVYREAVDATDIAAYAHSHFVPIDLYHHYRSLATRQHEKYVRSGRDPTVSRNLHLARAGLYARYVRDTHDFPRLDFPSFLDDDAPSLDVSPGTLDAVRDLVERKRAGDGDVEVGDPFPELAEGLPEYVDPVAHNVRGVEVERVNEFVARAVAAAQTW